MTDILQWINRKRVWFISAAVVLVIYALIGFFWVPRLARNAIEDYVHTQLQRKVSIGELTFNPFTFTARMTKFSLTEADDTPIASFDALLVNAELMSLVRLGAVFKEIRIDNPHALIRVNSDGTLNLAKLAPPPKEPKPEPATTQHAEEELPTVRIGLFAMRGGSVTVEDLTRPQPFKAVLAPIQFSLDNFRTEPKYGNHYKFAAATEDDERLEWSGEFTVQPLGSNGRFSLANIKATTVVSYLQTALPFNLPTGILDLQGNYSVAFTDHVDFRLQLPTLSARDLGVGPASDPAAAPWIVVPSLNVAGVSLVLGDRSLTVDEIGAGDAAVDAWREPDGSFNLMKLLSGTPAEPVAAAPDSAAPPTAQNPQAANAAQPASPWKIAIKNTHVDRARINFEDRSIKQIAKFKVAPVDLKVTDYSSEPGKTLNVDASVGINDSGLLTVAGPVVLDPMAIKLKVAVKDFGLSALQPYAAEATALTIHRGRLGLQSELEFVDAPEKGQPRLKIAGDVEVVDLLTKDNALEEDFIKWQSLKVSGVSYQLAPDKLNISRIYARKPYGRVIIASNSTLNITQVLNPHGATENDQKPEAKTKSKGTTGAAETEPILSARIRNIAIEDGSASFADYSVNPSFATEIADLKGSIEGLTSDPNSRAKVQLAGSVDRYAPVSIEGTLNLLSRETFTDIALSFRNIELSTFNPYSGKFAGYKIDKGKLTTEMQYKVEDKKLDAHHHIVIDQLEFGEATNSKDAVSMPIKFAVSLLKDRHGVIDLDLPVTGNVDDPQFKLGPIIWQVLKNTLDKIVTAPFVLLGKMFGGGEDLAFVDFPHGSAVPEQAAKERLDKLKVALIERPQLKLDVPMRSFDAADNTALTHKAFDSALENTLKANPDRLKALTALYAKEFAGPPVFPEVTDKNADVEGIRIELLEKALMEKFAATPAQLDELGRNRGNAVRDQLLAGGEISPERVFLSTREHETKKEPSKTDSPATQIQVIRMELKVE